jgi:actin-like ATPase involved in cell morphogenesis
VTYCLGIDLGTTYTSAAIVRDGRAETVPLGNRAPVIPSVVFLRDDEQVLTGEAATRRGVTEPGRLAREFKRRLGDPTPIIVGGSPYSADALMAKLLRWVVDFVTEQQGGAPDGIVVSYPANWGPYKTDLLDQAIMRAGLEGVFTITEPEAAAFHYASQERVDDGAIIAVFDLGGGTFDAAVLRKVGAEFEVLGEPQGIERLGGVDFDEAVFQFVTTALGDAIGDLDPNDTSTLAAVARLRQDCVDAKEALSSDTEVSIPVLLPNLQTEVRLTRAEFEGLIRPTLGDAITALERALRSAGVDAAEVTTVLLVGGSSRIPLVAQMVSSAIGRPVSVDVHPKHGVALGAALHAARRVAEPSDGMGAFDRGPEQIPPVIAAVPPVVTTSAAPLDPPAQAAVADPHGSSLAGRPLRKPLIIGLGVVALLGAVVGGSMLLGDANDDDSDLGGDVAAATTSLTADTSTTQETAIATTSPITTTVSTTSPVATTSPATSVSPTTNPVATTVEIIPPSSVPAGPFVRLTDVSLDDGMYLATYEVTGYVPQVDGGPDSLHIHLYLNDVEPENAGTTGPFPGTWDITDEPISFRTSVSPADAAARGATQLCALVATVTHGVFDPDSGTCLDLPA